MEISMEERIAIRDTARSLKKYGSTSSYCSKRYDSYVKHQVVESDTLQGLALKYGVTTEQIRRANRLWANDSIFLRKTLLIPVTGDKVTTPGEVVLLEADDSPINNNNNSHHQVPDEERSYNDFLVKIDCAIASTKSQIMVVQDNSEFVEHEDSIFWKRKGAVSRLKQQQQQQQLLQQEQQNHHQKIHEQHLYQPIANNHQSYQNQVTSNGTADLPSVMTQGRKVKNSLQRLEKEQDEIFEL